MVMNSDLKRAFIDTWFQGLIPQEHAGYLQLFYGDVSENWCIQPPMLSVWLKEDLDQFWDESFDFDENVERRNLRTNLLELAYEADRMHHDDTFSESEVRAVYDVLFWIYLGRTTPAKAEYSGPILSSDNGQQHLKRPL